MGYFCADFEQFVRRISILTERAANTWGSSSSAGGQEQLAEDSWGGGRKDQQQQQQFDIGTWENPGGSSGSTGASNTVAAAAPSADSGWSTDTDNTKAWSTGGAAWPSGETKDTAAWSTGEIGHWSGGGGGDDTTPKSANTGGGGGDWRNDSAGSVELSPGSQWKKEVVSVGSWADAVPSPRSDQEDNPLNASLDTVVRKIVW